MRKILTLVVLSILSASIALANVRVEASGTAIAPTHASGAQAMLLARRGAMLDLYRNLLGHDSIDVGTISKVIVSSESWDGSTYTVKGFIDR